MLREDFIPATNGVRDTAPPWSRPALTLPVDGDRNMARKPNYDFERKERDRLKAQKLAEKAEAKRAQRERSSPPDGPAGESAPDSDD